MHFSKTMLGHWVPKIVGMNIVVSRWVFKTKLKADGFIERHKARLGSKGYSLLERTRL